MLTLITGGERSGKSRHAQLLAESHDGPLTYVATSEVGDDPDFARRVTRHRSGRGPRWNTVEEPVHLGALGLENKVALVDCVTLWLANIWRETGEDLDAALTWAQSEFDKLADQNQNATLFVVTNELGMGVHAATHSARKFVELQGFTNQHIAKRADRVILMVSGIPVTVKSG